MSQPLFRDDILFLQRFLRASGFDPGPLDGIWGPRTDAAWHASSRRTEEIASELGTFATSERNIRTLQPRAQVAARNFGRAWDIGIFPGGRYAGSSPLYDRAAVVGLVPGLEWGGHWRTFKDRPHYQLASDLPLAARRRRFESGILYG